MEWGIKSFALFRLGGDVLRRSWAKEGASGGRGGGYIDFKLLGTLRHDGKLPGDFGEFGVEFGEKDAGFWGKEGRGRQLHVERYFGGVFIGVTATAEMFYCFPTRGEVVS